MIMTKQLSYIYISYKPFPSSFIEATTANKVAPISSTANKLVKIGANEVNEAGEAL